MFFLSSTINANKVIASWKFLKLNCPNGWEEFNNSCWKVFKREANWFQAKLNCEKNGGYLAEIIDSEKNDIIIKYLSSVYFFPYSDHKAFWLGMKNQRWVYDESANFNDWFPGISNSGFSKEPSDDGLRFVHN